MGTLAVEQRQVLTQVQGHTVLLPDIFQLGALVVLRPIGQAPASELPKCLDHGRAHVARIAMEPGGIARVHIDRREFKVLRQICRLVVLEPPTKELANLRVLLRHPRDLDGAVSQGDQAQRVGLHKALSFREHILPRIVVLEGPLRKHEPDLFVCDRALVTVRCREDAPCGGHGLLALPMHLQSLAIFTIVAEVLLVQSKPLCHDLGALRERCPADTFGHFPLKVRCVIGQHLREVQGRCPEWRADNLEHPMLKVEEEVLPLRPQPESLAQRLGMPVTLIAVIRL
mmetsp:Transcript_82173/g.227948  ORF Transcript_82173/g.227948 Transcript_82173/m.227948 type:complete len:285 (-) Transcript_82173:140-994(-)